MVDMLHWVAQADPKNLEVALPVFLSFFAISGLHLILLCLSRLHLRHL